MGFSENRENSSGTLNPKVVLGEDERGSGRKELTAGSRRERRQVAALRFSPKDMEENENSQSPTTSYQYPKETVRKRQSSVQNSGGIHGPEAIPRPPPPCTISELPPIDAVLISHNRYDHLHYGSVLALNERFGSGLRWFVPLGLLDWMQKWGCEDVIELDWWEENFVPGHDKVTFVFTPSQHWCKRTLLWGSWSVLGLWNRFFFAGDTGYCPGFKEIGKRFGPFDLAAIPIGAYEPRWFMKYQHVDPEDAVRIHIDIQTKRSVGIHWGTFALANEHYLEPPAKLKEALERYGLKTEDFFVLKHGESRYLNTDDKAFQET
ncbi:hypothetical protein ACRRTK_007423 [Alexandromys fortis]